MTAHLGIDLGTSSVKVVVIADDGQLLAAATAAYPVLTPRPHWAESSTDDWWAAVSSAVREAVAAAGAAGRPVAGIGLSGQMHGVVVTDDAGAALRPAILHVDTRAASQLAAYEQLSPGALARLANPLSPSMAGPMLAWLREHEPDVLTRTRWALQPKDWLRWRLTGQVGAEPADASATLLHDVRGGGWDARVAAALGLDPGVLAPLARWSGECAGVLDAAAATELGLTPGTPVAAGGGDTAVAALGSGLLEPGAVQLTIGTGGQIVTPLDVAPAPSAHPVTHLHRSAMPSGWYAMAAVLGAGLALDWVRRVLGVGWDELYAAAAAPARGDQPVFAPHLTGERTPHLDPGMRGAWVGLGLGHTRADLLRAALEGVAFNLADALDALPVGQGRAGGAPDPPGAACAIRLAGGGTTSAPWRQMLADSLGRPLAPLAVSHASARGAALLGALAAGGDLSDADVTARVAAWAPGLGEPVVPSARAAASAERRERYRVAVAALREGGGGIP